MNFLWKPPAGMGVRTLLAVYLVMIGAGYFVVILTQSRLTTSYALQATYAPLWVYGLALMVGGIALAVTRRYRRKWWSRLIAALVLILLAFISGTWVVAGAWTGVTGYLAMIWACLLEIGFVEDW